MSSDRIILEHRKPLSLSKAHKRLAAFIDLQLAAQPTLSSSAATAGTSVDDAATAAQLRAVDRVKVDDHILYQLQRIRQAIDEERQREKVADSREGQQDGSRRETAGKKRQRDEDKEQAAAAVDTDDADNLVESSVSSSSSKQKKIKDKKRKSTALTCG